VEKAKKQEEQEALNKEKQREEARLRSLEQAERDRAAATALKEEQEQERLVQVFSADRTDRLTKFEPLTDSQLQAELKAGVQADSSLAGALKLMLKSSASAGAEVSLDRYMALVYTLGPVWPLGLASPASIKLPNALRNRVKKARLRLRDAMTAFIQAADVKSADESLASEWQRGIIDGSIEPPEWNDKEQEAEERAQAEAKERLEKATEKASAAEPKATNGKKGKAKGAKEPAAEEDLDALLAEFGMSPDKKGGKKKK